jgi:protein O-mannosyl-transferase
LKVYAKSCPTPLRLLQEGIVAALETEKVTRTMKNEWKSSAAGAAIILLTLAAYLPAVHGSFIFDDEILILANPMVRPIEGIHGFSAKMVGDNYYPLTWALWRFEWRLWGDNTLGYHVVSILLHASSAILIWLILRQLKVPGAWVAGLTFALHPVNVASVAWISEQKNVLSMLFYAAAILLYLKSDETGQQRWYGLSLAAFLLALLSKTSVVMLPVVLLGCVWWLHHRVRVEDLLRSLPFFGLSLILGLATVWYQRHFVLQGAAPLDGFASRLAMAGRVPWFYLSKEILPLGLTVVYPKWQTNPSNWTSYIPGVLLIVCFVAFWWKRKTWGRPLLFGLGYFVATLFPVLGFFDQSFYSSTLVADHWQYSSIIGPIALVVASSAMLYGRLGERTQHCASIGVAAALMLLAAGTWRRSVIYATEETLWRDNVAKNPNACLARNDLGVALEKAGKISEAMEQFEHLLQMNPDDAAGHLNLGDALRRMGRFQEAIGQYEKALRVAPGYTKALYGLGLTLWSMGHLPEAIDRYEEALRIDPNFTQAHVNLGIALSQVGSNQDALAHFSEALRLRPDSPEVHCNLGFFLLQVGKLPEAVEHFEQALRIKPDYVQAHFNLGLALEKLGRTPEAIEHYQQALKLRPGFGPAKDALARLGAGQ